MEYGIPQKIKMCAGRHPTKIFVQDSIQQNDNFVQDSVRQNDNYFYAGQCPTKKVKLCRTACYKILILCRAPPPLHLFIKNLLSIAVMFIPNSQSCWR